VPYDRGVERYVIRGGREGYERLRLLARVHRADTAALFERAGLRPGMSCVDLGCGGGEVTLELAELVAPARVVGIDMDEVKLDLARTEAEARPAPNVEFRAGNLDDWEEPGTYDAAYSRAVLQHLSDPVGLLRRMWAALRPRGVLIVEDADFDGWCCHPPNAGFEFFVRAYGEVLARRGGDHAAGRKLYRHALDAGITGIRPPRAAQPVYSSGEEKTLAWSTLNETKDAIVSDGVATAREVEEALTGLRSFTDDPETLISGPRYFQLWAQRPGAAGDDG
jgi:ubiquinone/menaquinone biosynthesis C-methylase UbiE